MIHLQPSPSPSPSSHVCTHKRIESFSICAKGVKISARLVELCADVEVREGVGSGEGGVKGKGKGKGKGKTG